MGRSHPYLRRVSRALYGVISRSRALSRLWLLSSGALLRISPGFPLKRHIAQSIHNYPWPSVTFGKRVVWVAPNVSIRLIPHVGEFDFRALISRTLDYEEGVFEVLAARLARYDAVLEIGANVGVYSLMFLHCRRDDRVPVFCFEPSSQAFARLQANFAGETAVNFHLIPAAVTDRTGLVEFFEPEGHLVNGSVLEGFARGFSGNVNRRLVPSVGGAELAVLLRAYDKILIKLDAEGAEAGILAGLMPLVREKRPDIVLEVLEPYAGVLDSLARQMTGYKFYRILDDRLARSERIVASEATRDYLLEA